MSCLHHQIDQSKSLDPNQAAYDAFTKDYGLSNDGSSIEKLNHSRCMDIEYKQKAAGALAHIESKIAKGENLSNFDQRMVEPLRKVVNKMTTPRDPRVQVARDWALDISSDLKSITVPRHGVVSCQSLRPKRPTYRNVY